MRKKAANRRSCLLSRNARPDSESGCRGPRPRSPPPRPGQFNSRVAFFALLGLQLVVIGRLRGGWPWAWLLLLTLPAFPWWLRRETRALLRMISVLLDQVAAASALSKISPSSGRDSVEP